MIKVVFLIQFAPRSFSGFIALNFDDTFNDTNCFESGLGYVCAHKHKHKETLRKGTATRVCVLV